MRLPLEPASDRRQARALVMTSAEHRLRHLMLYRALYELVGDWASQTPGAGPQRPVGELLRMSQGQAQQPAQSPLPIWHDEADFRRATLAGARAYRRFLWRGLACSLGVSLVAAFLLYAFNS